MSFEGLKYLVVGAGFFGSVIAERIATDLKKDVMVIDRRPHIGGNCYSKVDKETGIEYHLYGSHIFHTSDSATWQYIKKFSNFTGYKHTVLTQYKNKVYQMPINLFTINSFYGLNLKPYEVEDFILEEVSKEKISLPKSLEEKAISLIGRPLYEAFIKGYTIKQWQTSPCDLPENIITRLPVRYNYDYSYFSDPWQGMPVIGYTSVFQNLLKHKLISLKLSTDYFKIKHLIDDDCLVIFTGPLDEFFNYKFGRPGWRSLKFEKEIIDVIDYQGTSVMNYAEECIPYTRIHEFKHLHPERLYPVKKTLIYKEYSIAAGKDAEPYYPVNTEKDRKCIKKYETEAAKLYNVIFGGRLGYYKYLDMDKTISLALKTYEEKVKPWHPQN
jgi:UDP-galactopyranose mutase